MLARFVFAIGVAMSLGGCGDKPIQTAEYFVFGTVVEVSVADVEPAMAETAFARLQVQFQSQHRDWHAWEPGKLTELNAAFARGTSAAPDPDILELVRLSQKAESLSGGRFNSAIGRLVGLWGFHTSDYPILGPPPGAADIAALVARHPSTFDIQIEDGTMFSRNPEVQLDLGGIAKGFAVDQACATLRELGIHNAIVNAGGDLRAFGSKGTEPWRVAIRNPFETGADGSHGTILGTIEVDGDEAVFTSGNYQRFRATANGERFAHILDPHTGWPAHNVIAATLITREGWKADAAATAFVVAGLSGWADVAKGFEIDQVLLADDQGRVHATPAMIERLVADDATKEKIETLAY